MTISAAICKSKEELCSLATFLKRILADSIFFAELFQQTNSSTFNHHPPHLQQVEKLTWFWIQCFMIVYLWVKCVCFQSNPYSKPIRVEHIWTSWGLQRIQENQGLRGLSGKGRGKITVYWNRHLIFWSNSWWKYQKLIWLSIVDEVIKTVDEIVKNTILT